MSVGEILTTLSLHRPLFPRRFTQLVELSPLHHVEPLVSLRRVLFFLMIHYMVRIPLPFSLVLVNISFVVERD